MPDAPTTVASYPIQATFVTVREIHFVSHRPPSPKDHIDQSLITITLAATPLNPETRRLQVTLTAELGVTESPAQLPFSVKVAITAEFAIATTFPEDKLHLWITQNSAFVIYPYLRERLHYITGQGGYPPILLPLMQIPTIKITPSTPAPANA